MATDTKVTPANSSIISSDLAAVHSWGAPAGSFSFLLSIDNKIYIVENDTVKPKVFGSYLHGDIFSIYAEDAAAPADTSIPTSFAPPSSSDDVSTQQDSDKATPKNIVFVYSVNGINKYITKEYAIAELPKELALFCILGHSKTTALGNVAWAKKDGTMNKHVPINWSKNYQTNISLKVVGNDNIVRRDIKNATSGDVSRIRSDVGERVQPESGLFRGITFVTNAPIGKNESSSFLMGIADFKKTSFGKLVFTYCNCSSMMCTDILFVFLVSLCCFLAKLVISVYI